MDENNKKYNMQTTLKGFGILIALIVLIWLLIFKVLIPFVFVPFFKKAYRIFIKFSHLDAVIVVALITGTVSLIGVIVNSIVSKVIEYKKIEMNI